MKKGIVIGIGLSIIVLAIIIGIASLPDTVLSENPTFAKSENLPKSETQIDKPVVEQPVANEPVVEQPVANEPVVEQPVANEPVVEQPVVNETVAKESGEEPSEKHVIKVEIRDGIGSGDK